MEPGLIKTRIFNPSEEPEAGAEWRRGRGEVGTEMKPNCFRPRRAFQWARHQTVLSKFFKTVTHRSVTRPEGWANKTR